MLKIEFIYLSNSNHRMGSKNTFNKNAFLNYTIKEKIVYLRFLTYRIPFAQSKIVKY